MEVVQSVPTVETLKLGCGILDVGYESPWKDSYHLLKGGNSRRIRLCLCVHGIIEQ